MSKWINTILIVIGWIAIIWSIVGIIATVLGYIDQLEIIYQDFELVKQTHILFAWLFLEIFIGSLGVFLLRYVENR